MQTWGDIDLNQQQQISPKKVIQRRLTKNGITHLIGCKFSDKSKCLAKKTHQPQISKPNAGLKTRLQKKDDV